MEGVKTLEEILKMSKSELKDIIKNHKYIVSISGMDNLGKSTQAKELHETYPELFSQPLHINQTEAFPKLKGKDLSLWWFDKNNYRGFVDTMYNALSQRFQMAKDSPYPIVILDKGIDFYDTRIKSTLLSLGVEQEEIADIVKETKAKYRLMNTSEDLKVVITTPKDEERSLKRESEKISAVEDTYDKYLAINIELLNEKIRDTQVFTPVEFVNNGVKQMHETILSHVAETLNEKNQFKAVEEITNYSKEYFKDNLKFLLLAGSAGKGKFIDNWSDIDLYYIFDKIPYEQIADFTDGLDNITDTHVGATFYSMDDVNNYLLDNRTFSTLRESQLGMDRVLYCEEGVKLPEISLNLIQKYDQNDLPNALNALKRELFYSKTNKVTNNDRSVSRNSDLEESSEKVFDTSKIIKKLTLVEKLFVRSKNFGEFTYSYDDTANAFAIIVKTELERKMEEESNSIDNDDVKKYNDLIDTICSYDALNSINDRANPEVQEAVYDYAMASLKAIDEIGYDSNKEQDFCMEDE